MPSIILLDNDDVLLQYHPESRIIHHRFKRFIFGEPFRQTMMVGSEALEKHKAKKWLSDDRLNGALPADDAKWGVEVWTPRVMGAGWKYWAIVLPEKAVGQLSMKRLCEMYSQMGVTTAVFSDPDQAMTWLIAQ